MIPPVFQQAVAKGDVMVDQQGHAEASASTTAEQVMMPGYFPFGTRSFVKWMEGQNLNFRSVADATGERDVEPPDLQRYSYKTWDEPPIKDTTYFFDNGEIVFVGENVSCYKRIK